MLIFGHSLPTGVKEEGERLSSVHGHPVLWPGEIGKLEINGQLIDDRKFKSCTKLLTPSFKYFIQLDY